jgi:periplasmic divalent cation tolerance protein
MVVHDETVVFITAPNENEAVEISKALVASKLAACVNILKGIRSIYSWQGRIEDDSEVLMIAKTQKKHVKTLANRVKELHSYDLPEVIALPIAGGSEDYLKWIRESTDIITGE